MLSAVLFGWGSGMLPTARGQALPLDYTPLTQREANIFAADQPEALIGLPVRILSGQLLGVVESVSLDDDGSVYRVVISVAPQLRIAQSKIALEADRMGFGDANSLVTPYSMEAFALLPAYQYPGPSLQGRIFREKDGQSQTGRTNPTDMGISLDRLIGKEAHSFSAAQRPRVLGVDNPGGRSEPQGEPQGLGEITDLVLTPDGWMQGAQIETGTFLGLGGETVFVEWSQLYFLPDPDKPAPQIRLAPSDEGLARQPQMPIGNGDVDIRNRFLLAQGILGLPVQSPDDKRLGTAHDIIVTANGRVRGIVLLTDGAWGTGGRKILIDWESITLLSENGVGITALRIPFSEAAVQSLPEWIESSLYP